MIHAGKNRPITQYKTAFLDQNGEKQVIEALQPLLLIQLAVDQQQYHAELQRSIRWRDNEDGSFAPLRMTMRVVHHQFV